MWVLYLHRLSKHKQILAAKPWKNIAFGFEEKNPSLTKLKIQAFISLCIVTEILKIIIILDDLHSLDVVCVSPRVYLPKSHPRERAHRLTSSAKDNFMNRRAFQPYSVFPLFLSGERFWERNLFLSCNDCGGEGQFLGRRKQQTFKGCQWQYGRGGVAQNYLNWIFNRVQRISPCESTAAERRGETTSSLSAFYWIPFRWSPFRWIPFRWILFPWIPMFSIIFPTTE